MDFYKRAKEIKDETVAYRRFLHCNAETGLNMPKAVEYVCKELIKIGLKPEKCGGGVTATLGKGERLLLLRADMDALPMKEESGLSFASKTAAAHTCGHDFHTAFLLSAAKLLKKEENKLNGRIKLMFQPAEENLTGCKNMIDSGLLDRETPDFALSFHVGAGKIPIGTIMYNSNSVMMYGADRFEIKINGKGGHGAIPNLNADPIKTAVEIYTAFKILAEKENVLITIGKFMGGDTDNIIPDTATLGGSLRTDSKEKQKYILGKLKEIVNKKTQENKCAAEVILNASVPPLVCNKEFTERVVGFIRKLNIENHKEIPDITVTASDDFSLITDKIPSAYIYLACGFDDERGEYTAHNPKVLFNEDVCPLGVAAFCKCAYELLK
ncbi:MAG: amidohydrolase [Clostridia bacterium]|nr:amidohydrolase [Clostridia bacterium]